MTVTISGTTGIDTVQDNTITSAKIVNATITQADLATEASSIGVGQTWQDVTGSRAVGTTYTNSTGKPIFIHIDCTNSVSAAGILLTINGSLGLRGSRAVVAGGSLGISSLIPDGDTYAISAVGGVLTLLTWAELR